jgi:ABC-type oligopeptide transport system substrate-binding subunit
LTGLVDPNPETSWLSELADKKDNNNITGFKDARVDEICGEYDKMFEVEDRVRALQELDGLIFKQHPYVLQWGADNKRLIYWDKFGQPEWYLPRTADEDSVLTVWWIDPEKEKRLKEARKDKSITLDKGRQVIRHWRQRSAE